MSTDINALPLKEPITIAQYDELYEKARAHISKDRSFQGAMLMSTDGEYYDYVIAPNRLMYLAVGEDMLMYIDSNMIVRPINIVYE